MTKSIASYPEHMRPTVVARRMRQYDPRGGNGAGTLAAKAQYDREQAKQAKAVEKIFSKPKSKKG